MTTKTELTPRALRSDLYHMPGRPRIMFEEGTPPLPTPSAEQIAAAKVAEDAVAAAAAAAAEAAKAKPPVTPEPPKTDAEKTELLREVMDKKAKLKEASDQLAAYDGVDPAKVRQLIAAEAAAEAARVAADTAALEAKGDFDRVKTMMAEAHKTEKDALQAQIDALTADKTGLTRTVDDLTVGASFGTSTFITEELTLAPNMVRKLYGDQFELKDGSIVGFDKPAGTAGRTVLVDASGTALGFEAALTKIVEADPTSKNMRRDKTKPGSSSKPTVTPGTPPAPTASKDEKFGVARIAAGLNNL